MLKRTLNQAPGSAVLPACLILLSAILTLELLWAQDGPAVRAPLKYFRKNCMLCHLPPDPKVETDRIWLTRLKDTA